MDGLITGEDNERVGLSVIDNNDAEHVIEMEFDGEIKYHQCEAYADHPKDRTPKENEYNEQARRFAKYYVYRERGYETLSRVDRPEYIDAVRRAIESLSLTEFKQFFSETHQQLKSHTDSNVSRPVDLPAGVPDPDAVLYKQDLYLGADLTQDEIADQAATVADSHNLDLEADLENEIQPLADLSSAAVERWDEFATDLAKTVEDDLEIAFDLRQGAVLGLHIAYPRNGELVTDRADDPLAREPDATLELLPVDHGSIEEFSAYLVHHLRCQVRDCYIGMGLLPPEEFRVLGMGKFICARRYNKYELYPRFHAADVDIQQIF